MKSSPVILMIALLMASAHGQTTAQPPKSAPRPTPGQAPVKREVLSYKVPKDAVAAPRKDGDAGSRGWTEMLPSLYVLAPNHTGLTTRGQPSLFWYQTGPARMRIEVTIIEPTKPKPIMPKPILRVGADKAEQGGIHRIRLDRYNVTLAPGVVYRWTVSLIPDPNNRSQDIIASDTIQRIEPDAQLKAALAGSKGTYTAAVYASHGIWYDALEAVTDGIDGSPADKDLRLQRSALIEQVGLKKATSSERK